MYVKKDKYNFLIQMHLILLLSSNSYFGGANIYGDSLFFSHSLHEAGWYFHKPDSNSHHPQAAIFSLTRGSLHSHCPRSPCVHRLNLIHLNTSHSVLLMGTHPSLPLQALPQRELAWVLVFCLQFTIYLIYMVFASLKYF